MEIITQNEPDEMESTMKKIKDYKKYSSNPYQQDLQAELSHTVKPRYLVGTKRGKVEGHVNTTTGELVDLIFSKTKLVDTAEFTKEFTQGLKMAMGLNTAGLKLYQYIKNNVNHQQDQIFLPMEKIKKACGYKTSRNVYIGISELLAANCISKSEDAPTLYYINPIMLFKGDRVTLNKTYILRRREGGISNQLEIEEQ